ncbi:hypothetical protein PHYBLDRAFT_73488 [Phycomyces blakesleeanus NRRL 1555(-)]|uniref:CHY-type domain-containing protein n=1 Tax=Phycomyces blakesleeanus (strain ATCC 8743b / DSM 1359 / FGSC 10004 / NBRC 33097 / NRRL 1555) TaxID=763407 RepID=A0A162PQ41_PHYB8|nr:hypothetical protein PHYBLDRAFT_73488 [Phycomyces blakesleeanus NRRL 1555(-)]OAD71866.1 hypothetical protein PHYBLDRAFT_73488 [Phycomyces blakesleeanus NRRL 1555(-)]|eukprot:XP_018289906.1 hypothetical protein PHYBLDRAFT_73488 [Phycomyces blakesleeanus NRRL 1555(-)]
MIPSDVTTPTVSARPAMRPPKPSLRPEQVRQVELSQLERRYRSSFRTVRTTEESTVVRLAIVPSDPDFPFELEALQLQLDIPVDYPAKHCSVKVMNPEIPPGFAFHLERGYDVYASKRTSTLVRQMDWMDKNMEILLQEPPAPTVKFVFNNNASHEDTLTRLSNLEISSPTQTENKPENPKKVKKPRKPKQPKQPDQPKKPKKPEHPAQPPAIDAPQSTNSTPTISYTHDQLEEASKKREQELRQLQARFRSTYKVLECDKNRIVVEIKVPLTDPDFTFSQKFGNELQVDYSIPSLYPLESCSVEIKNDTEYRRVIKDTFADYVKDGAHSLFSNLNWLNQKLPTILSNPVPVYHAQKQQDHTVSSSSTASTCSTSSTSPVAAVTAGVQITPDPSPAMPAIPFTEKENQKKKKKKTSLFDEQEKSNRVIIVSRPLVHPDPDHSDTTSLPHHKHHKHPKPESEDEGDSSDDNNDNKNRTRTRTRTRTRDTDSDSSCSSNSSEEEEEKKAPLPVAGPAARRGTAIRLIEPRLENVSLFYCLSLHLIVKCARCKNTVEIENLMPEKVSLGGRQEGKERWMTCTTCSSIIGAKFIGEFMHENARTVGCLQLAGCTPFDVLPSSFIGTCGKCMDDMRSPVRIAPNDQPASVHCFGCHAKMTIWLGDFKFAQVGLIGPDGSSNGTDRLRASEQQVMKLKLKKTRVKEELLTIGQPLPDQGTCIHYRKSKRWFRFSCCNKLYKCDQCHDRQEDHPCEMAKRHVCGLCSREQAIGPKPCACGHDFDRDHQKSAFWEGGQGTRNRDAMNRKDSHKYKGKAKVTSKKQERVGMAGKEKYQKKEANE